MMNREQESLFREAEMPQASRELAELRAAGDYVSPFQIVRRRVIDDFNEGRKTIDATLVIRIGDVEETEAASGVGIINALDIALRKALIKYFPFLESVEVTETYTHASGSSTDAEVMAVKRFSDGRTGWTTLAKSANTVEASWISLVDGYEWKIHMERLKRERNVHNPRLSQR